MANRPPPLRKPGLARRPTREARVKTHFYPRQKPKMTEQMNITEVQTKEAANSALGNPDTTDMGAIPDNVSGPSTITMQKIVKQLKLSKWPGAARIEIVQWPFEAIEGSVPVGFWMVGFNEAVNSVQGQLKPVAEFDPAWPGAGFATTLRMGGLCAYILKAGESVFPSNDPDIKGPVDPIDTVQLLYTSEMLHDNCRAIGGSYEVIDNTATLYQQGASTTCALDNPTNEKVQANVFYTKAGSTNVASSSMCDCEVLPFATSTQMVKQRKQQVLANKQGVFAPNRIAIDDNAPTQGLNYQAVFVGPTKITATNLNQNHMVLIIGQGVQWQSNSGSAADDLEYPTAYLGKLFKTNNQMVQTVIEGVNAAEYTFNLSRKLVTQCFTSPYSEYFSFAKDTHVPASGDVLSALVNAIAAAPVAFPSESNRNGTAFKGMFSTFKKGLKAVAKPATEVAKGVIKNTAKAALMSNPMTATAYTMAKKTGGDKLMKEIAGNVKKQAKPKSKAPQNQLALRK